MMTSLMRKTSLCILALGFTIHVSAATDIGPTRTDARKFETAKDYRLDADLSYLLNSSESGDNKSDKENLAFHLLWQRQKAEWGQEIRAEAVSANESSNGTSTGNDVERYMLAGKLLHRSNESIYQFLKLQADKDLSSAFDYQLALTGGVGFDLLKEEKQSLTTEVGAGYRYSKEREAPYAAVDEAIATLALYYEYRFNEMVRFNQDVAYEYGADAQTLRSRSSLSAALSKSISGLVSYQIKDLNADAGDSRDTLLSVGLKYRY